MVGDNPLLNVAILSSFGVIDSLVERGALEVESLFVRGGRNLLLICFLSLRQVLLLDLASLVLLFLKYSYHSEAYPINLRMAN